MSLWQYEYGLPVPGARARKVRGVHRAPEELAPDEDHPLHVDDPPAALAPARFATGKPAALSTERTMPSLQLW